MRLDLAVRATTIERTRHLAQSRNLGPYRGRERTYRDTSDANRVRAELDARRNGLASGLANCGGDSCART